MSSGKVHDHVNSLAILATLGFGVITLDPNVAAIAMGMSLGTIWLSPDLDLSHSRPSKRFGPLKLLLIPYVRLCGHHRSFISHSPLFSNIFRVLYFGFLPALFLIYLGQSEILTMILRAQYFWMIMIGLEISNIIHLFLDFQYSLRKKLKL